MKKLLYTIPFFLFLSSHLYAQSVDVLHYRYGIDLYDNHDTIYGTATVTLVTKAQDPILIDLKQRGEDGKGMLVTRVEKPGAAEAYPFLQKNNQVQIPVVKGAPGDTLSFRIFYKGVPADGLIISKNKFGDRTFFADNWPNRAHHWIPAVDRPDDKASFEFIVSAPQHYRVVSNGIKVAEQLLPDERKQTHWKEENALPTKVMVIGVARFAVKTYESSPPAVPVSAWVYPKDSARGFHDFALAPSILDFFSGYIGPYPFTKLANVQSTTIFGGMENASAIFYAENAVTGNRSSEDLQAHEIAHQWFGDAASEKSFAHVWLSEGFATYLTNVYWENKYGRAAMAERLKKDREDVIAFARTSTQAVVDSTENLMSLLNANSYQKGSWVLHMLRNEIGDTAFRQTIRTYYNRYKGSNASTDDFKAVAESVSGKDLSVFFRQWLYRPGIPVLDIKTYQDKGVLVVSVAQQQAASFQFPLEILVEGEEGQSKLIKETISASRQLSRHKLDFTVKKITVDPNSNLLFQDISKKKSR